MDWFFDAARRIPQSISLHMVEDFDKATAEKTSKLVSWQEMSIEVGNMQSSELVLLHFDSVVRHLWCTHHRLAYALSEAQNSCVQMIQSRQETV